MMFSRRKQTQKCANARGKQPSNHNPQGERHPGRHRSPSLPALPSIPFPSAPISHLFQKILTFPRQRPDFGAHKWDFVAQKRRFKIQKRRFCLTLSET